MIMHPINTANILKEYTDDDNVISAGYLHDVIEDTKYTKIIKSKIDIIIGLYTDSLTSLKRDYTANTSLEKRTFLNEDNINEYNNSLMNMNKLSSKENINFYLFDTTNKSEREISFEVLDKILTNMRNKYINILNNEYNK